MHLENLSDKELVNYAGHQLDPLTSTDLERELIKRLATWAEDPLLDVVSRYDFDHTDIETLGDALICDTTTSAAMLKAISESGIDDPKHLKKLLVLLDQLHQLINEKE